MAYVTVGTGVGVGLVVNGKVVHGLTHPEGGHISIKKHPSDSAFSGVCRFHGDCLEGLTVTGAISKRKWTDVKGLEKLSDDDNIWNLEAYYLAQLALNLTLTASPEAIVFGGGVLNRKCLLTKIQQQFVRLMNNYVSHPLLSKNRIK